MSTTDVTVTNKLIGRGEEVFLYEVSGLGYPIKISENN